MATAAAPAQDHLAAQALFSRVWCEMERHVGLGKLCFPKHMVWLNGAPGAGKGTNTPLVMQALGITTPPIVIGELLTSPSYRALIDAGQLVDDAVVIGLLIRRLLEPSYREGALIDGFPRTRVQAECVRMIRDQLSNLSRAMSGTPRSQDFPAPDIRFVVLQVTEQHSVARQLKRGREAQAHNAKVQATGQGELREVRATDIDAALAATRYRVFCEQTVQALEGMRDVVSYHQIDATGDVEEVQKAISVAFRDL